MTIRQLLLYLSYFLFSSFVGCKDNTTNPSLMGGNSICYEKLYNGKWEIFTNNVSGTNPKNISNYVDDDEYPQWSPNGKYIIYSRSINIIGPMIYIYDVNNMTSTNLTSDGGLASLMPKWAPNGKVYFAYQRPIGSAITTYLMNPDGSEKKKILDSTATIYFYEDSYNFLYIYDYTKVYKSNIDGTVNEYLFDIQQNLNQFGAIQGFNSNTEQLLITFKTTDSMSAVATYDIKAKNVNILLTADEAYTFFQVKYSKDFSKIAIIEHSANDEYLSVLENGIKERLVRIPKSSPPINFSYEPMEFSFDGRYIAFSEQIFHSGSWISFSTPLYIVDIIDGSVRQLDDESHYPSWSPDI